MVSAYIVLDLGMAVAAHKHWSSPWRVGAHRYVGRHQPCECGVAPLLVLPQISAKGIHSVASVAWWRSSLLDVA